MVVVIDRKTDKLSFLESAGAGSSKHNGIYAAPDLQLYCTLRGASTVLAVDPKTDKLSFIRRPKDEQAKLH